MKKKTSLSFRILVSLIRLFYGKVEVVGMENYPEKDAILVANHAQMNGPICGELYLPKDCYIWCAGEMMKWKEVPPYAFQDFWSQKPKWTQPFYKLLSYLITPLAVCLLNNARTIPVYKDMRVMSAFKISLQMLSEGRNILIFPEKDEKHNNVLYQFQENFVDIAKLYYKKTGEELVFVPVYVAPRLRRVYIGEGIAYNSECSIEDEKSRLCKELSDEITKMARSLPEHTVVPYRNIPKKHYLKNTDITEVPR